MLLQTSIYSSIFKITASNFQEMLLRDSTLKRQHKLDFDEHNHKVPFVIPWPIYFKMMKSQVLYCLISSVFILTATRRPVGPFILSTQP